MHCNMMLYLITQITSTSSSSVTDRARCTRGSRKDPSFLFHGIGCVHAYAGSPDRLVHQLFTHPSTVRYHSNVYIRALIPPDRSGSCKRMHRSAFAWCLLIRWSKGGERSIMLLIRSIPALQADYWKKNLCIFICWTKHIKDRPRKERLSTRLCNK